jgi:hypothetical protein
VVEACTVRRALAAAALLLACSCSIASAESAKPEPDCAARPTWCQPGYVCIPTRCAAEATVQLELLSAEVDGLRKKKAGRRWGCQLGAGMGVTVQVDAGDVSLDAAPILGAVTCGWNL